MRKSRAVKSRVVLPRSNRGGGLGYELSIVNDSQERLALIIMECIEHKKKVDKRIGYDRGTEYWARMETNRHRELIRGKRKGLNKTYT